VDFVATFGQIAMCFPTHTKGHTISLVNPIGILTAVKPVLLNTKVFRRSASRACNIVLLPILTFCSLNRGAGIMLTGTTITSL
jgi:hypothetical protein